MAAPGGAIASAAAASRPLAHTSIVGGESVPIAAFPFQVALYDPRAGSVAGGFFCGGVVIDATHVATAAHCAIDESTGHVTPPADIAVLAGAARLGGVGASYPGAAIEDPASVTSLDPAYEPSINDYDVAVIGLRRPLWTGPTPSLDGHSAIAPIHVSAALAGAYADPTPAGAPIVATVSGWGDTRAESSSSRGLNGSYPSDLHAVTLPLIAPTTCAGAFSGPFSSSQPITARMLCAGEPSGGRDSCFGDSGGPLVVRSAPGGPSEDVLAGLVSFGEGCAQAEGPGVYASIANPEIASFLTSNPPQTPLGQEGFGRSHYVYACTRRHRPCRAPAAAGHHHHHHRHHRHHHKRA